jgi:hypothetical protein
MYLARHYLRRRVRYTIRESYREGGHYRSRDLFDLGADPSAFVVYPGGNAFYVHESVTDRLCELGVTPTDDELDDIFWPFIDPDIRHRLDVFRNRAAAYRQKAALSPAERDRIRQETHLFDRRRVHFLRVGRMDQGNIGRMPAAMLRWLGAKSRDEVEQRFMKMEGSLKPHEYKAYVFVIFDLSRHFSHSFARSHPQMLDPEAVDKCFETELCRLNEDAVFWAGYDRRRPGTLQAYLRRYAIMFFDGQYGPNRYLESFAREFMNRHRFFKFPQSGPSMGYEEAGGIFDESPDKLRRMDRAELTRLYRSKARRIHPDTGGDHEGFINLTNAYQGLMRKKPRR